MKKTQRLFLVIGLIFLNSCSPKITTNLVKNNPPLDYKQEVIVIGLSQEEPENGQVLGQVKIGDTGFTTNCSFDIVIDKAKLEARKAGGNVVKIIKHKFPSLMGSSCHRITAKIIKVKNIERYAIEEKEEDLLDVDYAILNVYRYKGAGALVGYDLYLGDSLLCRVRNNFKKTIHIKNDGLNSLWARTEVKSEIPISIKKGKTYYLRCSLSLGAFVGRPKLELVDSKTGKHEFESFNAKNK